MEVQQIWQTMRDLEYGNAEDEYSKIAMSYDKMSTEVGYVGPEACAALADELICDKSLPIGDLGAGTGRVGTALRSFGFQTIHGIDCSREMLNFAHATRAYVSLTVSDLIALDLVENFHVENVIASGVFSPGHANPASLAAISQTLPKGGLLILTLNDWAIENDEYYESFNRHIQEHEFKTVAKKRIAHCTKKNLNSEIFAFEKP